MKINIVVKIKVVKNDYVNSIEIESSIKIFDYHAKDLLILKCLLKVFKDRHG